jgi:hypothetical protein
MKPAPDPRPLESGDDDELYVLDGVPISYVLDDGNGNRSVRTVFRWKLTEPTPSTFRHDEQEVMFALTMLDGAVKPSATTSRPT